MIKVDVISGFLGAGKTTLIKRLFAGTFSKTKTVLIENEFGEIGIDGSFLKESGVKIKEINAGCICCSLVGDFATSLKEVIEKFNPDRIIIEPSGVGKLSDIVGAIMKVDAPLSLNIIATVVDGPKAKMYIKNFGEFFNNQIEAANTIIVSKVDKMSADKVDEVVALVREKNQHANIITTNLEELDADKLLQILEQKVSLKEELIKELAEIAAHDEEEEHEHHHHHHHHHDEDEDEHECCCHHDDDDDDEDEHECCCHHDEDEEEHEHHHEEHECCCHHDDEDDDDEDEEEEHEHHHHHHHDADEVFTSWGIETAKAVSYDELNKFLTTLANDESLGIVVRSKGILKASDSDKWYYFDFVSGDFEIRKGEPDYTGRIVVIGSKIDEHKIEHLFFGK